MESGGAERVISVLANKFIEKKCDVSIITFSHKNSSFDLNKKINFLRFQFNNKLKQIFIPLFFVRFYHLYRSIEQSKIDTIISFTSTMNLYSIIINFIFRKKLIISERDDPINNKIGFLKSFLRKSIYKRSDYLVVQNKIQFEYFEKMVPKEKLSIIRNPVNLWVNNKKNNKANVVALGRLTPKKNHKALIRSFIKSKIDSKLIIIGDGIIKNEIEKYALKLDNEKRITFLGYQKNVNKNLFLEDIYISTSTYEGFPNSLLESMSAGLACIHYDCPSGINEIIEDGHNGFLIDMNDEEAFSQKLKLLHENSTLRRKFSKNAQLKVKEYDSGKISKQWLKLIDSI